MIKKILPGIGLLVATCIHTNAQVITALPGSDITIKQGTVFFADNLVLTPSADFTISNTTLSHNITVSHQASSPYIARVYHFSGATAPFSGSIKINYTDGAELNGLAESGLQLNIHNGIGWQAFNAAANDVTNNYVFTPSISNIILSEMTLAENDAPLPLQWRSFTVAKQQESVSLAWSTFTEQNTRFFTIQTSIQNTAWKTIDSVPAAGNSNTISNYNYVHTTPVSGYNNYRIVETDADGRENYSIVRRVYFTPPAFKVELLGNPVTDGTLRFSITESRPAATSRLVSIFSNSGALSWKQQVNTGVHTIDVSRFAKGTYILTADDITIKFLIR